MTPPTFLAIGPEKTASGWLHSMLDAHPAVSVPPMKEVGYLWQREFLPDARYRDFFTDPDLYFVARRRYLKRGLRGHVKALRSRQVDSAKLAWDLRYASGPHNDGWYRRLFATDRPSGDVTPKYCELSDAAVERVRKDFGPMQIIVGLRDPIEREWSRAKMNCCHNHGRTVESVPHDEWIANFHNGLQADANDYPSLIRRWQEHFGTEAVYLCFYDEVVEDPGRAFANVCTFLGVEPIEADEAALTKRVYEGVEGAVPEVYQRYLFDFWGDSIRELAAMVSASPYPARWIERHENLSPSS